MIRQSLSDGVRRQLANAIGMPNVDFLVTSIVEPGKSELHIRQIEPDFQFTVGMRNVTTMGEEGVGVTATTEGLVIRSRNHVSVKVVTCTSARRNKVKVDINMKKDRSYAVTVMIPTNTSAMLNKSETTTSQQVVGTPRQPENPMDEMFDIFGLGSLRRGYASQENPDNDFGFDQQERDATTRHPFASSESDDERAANEHAERATSNGSSRSNGHPSGNGHASHNGNGSPKKKKKKVKGKQPQAKQKKRGSKKMRGGRRNRRHQTVNA